MSRGRNLRESLRVVDDFASAAGLGPSRIARTGWKPLDSSAPVSILSEFVKVELRRRFREGEQPTAGEYLGRYPELRDHAISLAFEEFFLLEEHRRPVQIDSFCERYPDWRESLKLQLQCYRLFTKNLENRDPVEYPALGTRFAEDFELLEWIGGGGGGQVYRVDQASMRRKAVLKVTPIPPADQDRECETQGALDHPRIVPIYSVHTDKDRGLRGICMPNRPGRSLDQLLPNLGASRETRRASDLLRNLVPEWSNPSDDRPPKGWEGYPSRGNSDDAVAWLGIELAEALAHTHRFGIIHCDIKPGNILIGETSGPQLLDFNLAREYRRVDRIQDAHSGGTLPYMAPEQLQAFLDPDSWPLVGPQADLYSLGLILLELLTGERPPAPRSTQSLGRAVREMLDRRTMPTPSPRDYDPRVASTLDAIIGRCLEPSLANRYGSSEELIQDLREFLDEQRTIKSPLARRGSIPASKGRRRLVLSATILSVLLGVTLTVRSWPQTARDRALELAIQGQAAAEEEDWASAREFFESALALNPEDARTLHGLGFSLWKTRIRGGDAIEVFEKCMRRFAKAESIFRSKSSLDDEERSHLANLLIDRAKVRYDYCMTEGRSLDPDRRFHLLKQGQADDLRSQKGLSTIRSDNLREVVKQLKFWSLVNQAQSEAEMSLILGQQQDDEFIEYGRSACNSFESAFHSNQSYPPGPLIVYVKFLTRMIATLNESTEERKRLTRILPELERANHPPTDEIRQTLSNARAVLRHP